MQLVVGQIYKFMALISSPMKVDAQCDKSRNKVPKGGTNRKRTFSQVLPILLMLMLFSLAGCGMGEPTDAQYMQQAWQHYDKEDFKEAIIEIKNALQQNPSNTEARFLLGKLYVELGDGASAEKELSRAGELGVVQDSIMVPLIKAMLLQGKNTEIIAEFNPKDTLPPSIKAQVHSLRGMAYLAENKLGDADEEFRVALKLVPNQAAAQIGKGRLAAVQGKMEEARKWIAKALTSAPESADAWSLLGDIELAVGNPEEAETAFSNAIIHQKYLTPDVAKRALARIRLEKYSEADADISKLIERGFNDNPFVNYIAGLSFFNQKKYAEAAEAFQASLEKNPSSILVAFYLASSHYFLGNMEQARDIAERLRGQAPRSVAAKSLLGAIDINRANFDAATNVLEEALRRSPDNEMVISMLADASLLSGDTTKSIQYYQRLAVLEPESPRTKKMLMLAMLMHGQSLDENIAKGQKQGSEADSYTREFFFALQDFQNGNLGKALEQTRKLHEKHPNKVDPIKLAAACYLAAAQWSEAAIELEKALQLEPNELSAARNLAIVNMKQGDLKGARSRLQTVMKGHPKDEKTILLLASVENALGNPEAGTRVLEEGLARNLKASSVRARLAGAYLSTGKVAKVLEITNGLNGEDWKEAPELLELRGKAQVRTGDLAAAKDSFRQWVDLVPDSAKAHFLYGDVLARRGEKELAREQLVRAVQLDPGYLPARIGEVKMLVHSGKIEEAREALIRLSQDFGTSPQVQSIEGWFALGTGEYATAADRLTTAAKEKPTTELTILIRRALWAQGKREEAITLMKQWLEHHPKELIVLLQLAEDYLALNREKDAKTVYKQVLQTYPDHLPTLNNLAWLSRDDDLEQALEYAAHAYQLSPDDAYVLDTYGVLLLKKGDTQRGHRMLQKAVSRLPDDPELQLHLGRALISMERLDDAKAVLGPLIDKATNKESSKEAAALLESISQ